jgi:hypothetical protein
LIEGALQSCFAEVVGAHKAITPCTEHPKTCPAGEGRVDAGDPILFCEQTDVVGALEEHFNEVSSGSTATMQEGLQESPPLIRKGVGQENFWVEMGEVPQRTAG